MYPDLKQYVAALESAGELVRVSERVSPINEIGAIADRVSKMRAPNPPSASAMRTDPAFHHLGGPALLFERVEGCDTPVLINAFGSYRRMEMALGRSLEAIAEQIGGLVKPEPPRSLGEAVEKGRSMLPLLRIGPKRRRGRGACPEVLDTGEGIDLTRLGLIRCWDHDGDFEALGYPGGVNRGVEGLGHPSMDEGTWEATQRGRYITLAGIHTIHADDRNEAKPKSHNIGMYRVQLLGRDRLAMHWHMHHDGAAHWRSWKKLGEPMPVAIALGGPSVLPYAATCPLPPGISELLMAGFLNGSGIRMVRGVSVPLWVPADAEIVIEGHVRTDAGYPGWDPREAGAGDLGPGAVFEGPFGDHTGFYSLPDRYPVLEVSAVTRRREAIFPATVVGLPPQEDYFLGKATERIMLPLLKTLIHDIEDYDLPMFGAFHNCVFVKIRKQYPLHARRVMHAIWGAGQMAWTKSVFVVDEDVDVHDARAVLGACARWCRPGRDIERVNGALDILDHAAPRLGAGVKIGFDCTRKIAGEEVNGVAVGGEADGWEADREAVRGELLGRARSIEGVLDVALNEDAPGWVFVRADRGLNESDREGLGRRIGETLLESPFGGAARFAVVLGRDVDVFDTGSAMFHWLANSDASRDALWRDDRVVFDATAKTAGDAAKGQPVRAWAPVLRVDEETAALVERRGGAYGLG
ncbi:MAG: UbiD family decarboxylase domain-containing protein [Phycisphaerales bacterium JB059]